MLRARCYMRLDEVSNALAALDLCGTNEDVDATCGIAMLRGIALITAGSKDLGRDVLQHCVRDADERDECAERDL